MIDDGLMVGEKTTPIVDVCLYVPRGKGSFPSVLCMLGIPAVVAKVPKIVVVTPPKMCIRDRHYDSWEKTVWSAVGGSASGVVWPYWWHFIYGGF